MELYDRPVDLFTAGFVGVPPIGLLPARLVSAGGQAGFVLGSRTLPLWRQVPPSLRDHVGREVLLGLRAEDVQEATAAGDPDAVALDAVVTDAEFTGRRTVVTVTVDAPPVTAPGSALSASGTPGATLRAFFGARAGIRPGDTVRVAVTAASAHVFDAVTGRALWHPRDGRPGTDGR
jgi:multiple sugar transport system ATP-binding protein